MAGIFSRFIFNNAIFNTDSPAPPFVTGGGGFDLDQYKKYLQSLIAKPEDNKQYVKRVKKAKKALKKTPIKSQIIIEAANVKTLDLDSYDFTLVQKEAERLLMMINSMIQQQINEEDEIALLLFM